MRILLADDEPLILDFLSHLLTDKRFVIKKAQTLQQAKELITEGGFDLIILDRDFGEKEDGISLIEDIHRQQKDVPILILSALKGSRERSYALNKGADDYLEKPYDPAELLAKVRALLRRKNKAIAPLEIPPFIIDEQKGEIMLNNKILELKLKEYQLLYYFLKNSNRIITEAEILEHIWNDDGLCTRSNTINVHMMRLRRQIGKEADRLKTLRGRGFIFETNEQTT